MLQEEEIANSEKDYLQRHKQCLLELASKIFGAELSQPEHLNEKLPLIRWKGLNNTPGAFALYVLCSSDWNRKTVLFVEEMLSNWLIPGRQLKIINSGNLSFHLPSGSNSLFFIELLTYVPENKTKQAIQKHLPGFADELKLGILSPEHAKHILEMKRLAFAGNTSFIYDSVAELIRRYPSHFSHDIFPDAQYFLSRSSKEFRQIRNHRHLCRIICAHYLFQKALKKSIRESPHRRHIHLKFLRTHLHYPLGLKRVLGIAISLNSLQDYESFELRHIIKAIQRLIPHVRAQQDAYYSYRNEENNLRSLYLEIENTKGENFTLEELKLLKKELINELKNSIEYLSPSLFIPHNEEELIRNIIHLSQELRYIRDLPQASISFQEQHNDKLRFHIVLLRLLNQSSRSVTKLSRYLPNDVHFIPERVANVGMLRKKYVKEANVFSLEVENQLFLRKNHSVDLVNARQYIVKALEKMFGNFWDYNERLLLKQSAQLEAIKEALGSKGRQNAFLLENLFCSLTPSLMQAEIPPEKGVMLCALFLQALEERLPHPDESLTKTKSEEDAYAVVIKTAHPEIKERLTQAVKELEIDPLQLVTASVEVDRNYYHCFLYLNPTFNQKTRFINRIDTTLSSWLEKKQNLQVLHLHLPRATQSLDPRLGSDRTSGVVIKMLYEGLMRIAESGRVEPAIAKTYTLSEDKRTYRFSLRESVWSNGSSLTAYDFEYAWKKILEPDFRFPYSFLFFPIKNAEAVKKGEKSIHQVGVRAIDAHTLLVELEYPFPTFPSLTTSWVYFPLCREIDQKHPGWAYHSGDTHVCNGPFKLDIWKRNDDLQIVKNPLYWDASFVKLDLIQIRIIEKEKMALDLFSQGELDWMGDPLVKIPPLEIPHLKKQNILHTSKQFGLFWIQLNYERYPFQSRYMRKAFAVALNRKKLIDNILLSDDLPAYGLSSTLPKTTSPSFPENDPSLAKTYFKKGLEELGISPEDLPPIVITHSEIEEQETISHEIGSQWEDVLGIEVKYERILWNTYFEALHRGDTMLGVLSWYPRYEDPIYFYDRLVYREHTLRVTTWKNPHYAQLIEEARYTQDPEILHSLLQQAEKILYDEMPVIPLFYQKFRFVKNPRLKGYILSNANQIDFRAAYLENNDKENDEPD